MVYLDWNATTPLRACARDAWLAAQDQWANPASVHGPGQQARWQWDQTMNRLAELLGCRPHEVIATSGGTEALALAIHAQVHEQPGRVVASVIDHSAVMRNAERQPGVTALDLVPVDDCGRLDPQAVVNVIATDTRLVCLQWVNNETGTIQDLAALVSAIRAAAPDLPILVDACQMAGKAAIDFTALDVDLLALAGHKFGAPKGTGLLLARSGRPFPALISGGRQQDDRRSGTQDLPALQAVTAALVEAQSEAADLATRQQGLLGDVFARLQADLAEVIWIAAGAPRIANTLSLGCPGVDAKALVTRLDLAGFAVSVGSACMARFDQPSHVIAALGLSDDLRRGVIRVSIGSTTTATELAGFAEAYVREVRAMRG